MLLDFSERLYNTFVVRSFFFLFTWGSAYKNKALHGFIDYVKIVTIFIDQNY